MACQLSCPLFKTGIMLFLSLILIAGSLCCYEWGSLHGDRYITGIQNVTNINTTYTIYQRIERDIGLIGSCIQDHYDIHLGTAHIFGPSHLKNDSNNDNNNAWINIIPILFGPNSTLSSFPFPLLTGNNNAFMLGNNINSTYPVMPPMPSPPTMPPTPPTAPAPVMTPPHYPSTTGTTERSPEGRPQNKRHCISAHKQSPIRDYTSSFDSILPIGLFTINDKKAQQYSIAFISSICTIVSLALMLLITIIRGILNCCCNKKGEYNPNRVTNGIMVLLGLVSIGTGIVTIIYYLITMFWLSHQLQHILLADAMINNIIIDTSRDWAIAPVMVEFKVGYSLATFGAGILLLLIITLQALTQCCCQKPIKATHHSIDEQEVQIVTQPINYSYAPTSFAGPTTPYQPLNN